MELRILRYFLTVAKEKSISKAARTLHITQPTLSRQLQELEQELGKTLFIRSNKEITLTEDGRLLRKRAEEIVRLTDKTIHELTTPNDEIAGDVFIGCAETDEMRNIIRIMKQMQTQYPNVQFHIYSGDKQIVLDDLDRGLIDFGIFIDPIDKTKYDYLPLPTPITLGIIVKKDDSLAKKKCVTKEDIQSLPLIISRQLCEDSMVMSWFGVPKEMLHIVATYNLIFNASLMVSEGMGYAITIDHLIDATNHPDLCFIPLYPTVSLPIYILWKKNQLFSKASTYFLAQVKKILYQNKKKDE